MPKKTTRKRQKPPDDETKKGRFIRVVTPRVNKAVKAIAVIGYCSSSVYEYTDDQVADIMIALEASVELLKLQFSKTQKSEGGFTFKG